MLISRTFIENGKSYANRHLVLYVLDNQTGHNRLGISVSKKVGNSVVRHRVTRLIRESYRLHEDMFNSGLDMVVIARKSAGYRTVRILKVHFFTWENFTVILNMKTILIELIRFYQKYLSPLKSTKCPYIPSCSQYGLEAVQKYGALKGGLLALWRILRCNPFSKGGYDPVP